MSHFQVVLFSILLGLLILMSAFFSCAETGLMSINRYRLRHKARMKKRSAVLILRLLKRPDRLLGMILIGNTFAIIFASELTTLLTFSLFGEKFVFLSTLILTLGVLVFAEVAPKTVAALYPEKISRWVAFPVFLLLKLFYPLVWLINSFSNGLLRLFNIKVTGRVQEPLSREELRSVVYETAGKVTHQYQSMLLSILDLNKLVVEDVMIPQHEIVGIDLESDWSEIQKQLGQSPHDWLPVYRENINDIVGVLHLRELTRSALAKNEITKESLVKSLHEPYFVPEGTSLNVQLINFQQQRKHIALVVDEYGEIQGLVTMQDILEEIVGEFTTSATPSSKIIKQQADGSYTVDGSVTIREFNRVSKWHLPTSGPRTLNGLIIEYLEAMPHVGTCILIKNYPIEILQVDENKVTIARVSPSLEKKEDII